MACISLQDHLHSPLWAPVCWWCYRSRSSPNRPPEDRCVLRQGVSNTLTLQTVFHHNKPSSIIVVRNAPVENTYSFLYLGSMIYDDASVTEEITNQIKQASSSLLTCLLQPQSSNHKVAIYNATCISTSVSSSGSWASSGMTGYLTPRFLERMSSTSAMPYFFTVFSAGQDTLFA